MFLFIHLMTLNYLTGVSKTGLQVEILLRKMVPRGFMLCFCQPKEAETEEQLLDTGKMGKKAEGKYKICYYPYRYYPYHYECLLFTLYAY